MADTTKEPKELRFKNVSLHRRGKPDNGTLYLTSHHLIFSYYPSTQPNGGKEASTPQTHGRGTSLTTNPVVVFTPNGSVDKAEDTPKGTPATQASKPKNTPRPRSKEVYIPYPLVSFCNLRPSHAQSTTVRPPGFDDNTESPEEDDDGFPPTYGTSLAGRPSTDSATRSSFASPRRPASPVVSALDLQAVGGSARTPAIRIRCKDFQVLALHFHPTTSEKDADEAARQAFFSLRGHCCVDRVEDLYAFHFKPPPEEKTACSNSYDARKEFSRMGISPKAAEGPGAAWRISDINHDFSYSATYPSVLCVPRTVSDNMLKYGGTFRKKARIPALAYLHSNGGSITRCSQPMVGMQGKRNPQDERLVSAIFSSHTPPLSSPEGSPSQAPSRAVDENDGAGTADESLDSNISRLHLSKSETALDESFEEQVATPRKRVYGSTRQNVIADARPKLNVLANRATGGGIENAANYAGHNDMPIEVSFLNIANIHVMRSSLDKVIESLGNSDYLDLPPSQDLLRKSGWLSHIAGVIDGSEMVARVVGLGGSHVLVHCSDGWDRTSQVSALAQIMLDPYYRTLDGFIALVQKDFLSFGHKFRDRNGIEGCEKWFEIENERIQPARTKDDRGSEANNLQALSSKALSGAKSWFEKNRGNLFKQQNASHDSLSENPTSRPASPPPNPILHSTPAKTSDKKHKMDPNEVSPIFHQFLDAVFQLQWQAPHAFEFNERFLRRLFYQVYAGQYGEFLFNNERERSEHADRLPSAWGYFLARRAEFTNPEFTAKADDPLLFPRRQGTEREIEVRWWNMLFGRKDEEMNVPKALAPPERSAQESRSASVGAAELLGTGSSATAKAMAALVGSVNKPANSNTTTPEAPATSSTGIESGLSDSKPSSEAAKRPPLPSQETDTDVLARYAGASSANETSSEQPDMPQAEPEQAKSQQVQQQSSGDPLGVSAEEPQLRQQQQQQQRAGGMDFASFAQQNAFRDS
jgi:myotubularin-related protein 6/7/8